MWKDGMDVNQASMELEQALNFRKGMNHALHFHSLE